LLIFFLLCDIYLSMSLTTFYAIAFGARDGAVSNQKPKVFGGVLPRKTPKHKIRMDADFVRTRLTLSLSLSLL